MKTCSKCKKEKPFTEFNKNKTRRNGYQHYCRMCCKKANAIWYGENKETSQEYQLKAKYGITIAEKNNMLKLQDNRCAICNKEFLNTSKVDHCHTTKKVRGLLCHQCNTLLGHAKDNIQILQNAVQYLITHQQ